MKNIAVFFGGVSVEHEVSVITGVLTLNSIDKTKYNPLPVFVDENGFWYTGEALKDIEFYKNPDYKRLTCVTLVGGENKLCRIKGKRLKEICALSAAINCMHGERGEDGALEGVLAMHGIPSCSPPIACSAVCMDKALTKLFAKGLGIKTLKGYPATTVEECERTANKIGFPVIIKPCTLGSSIGISVAKDGESVNAAAMTAFRFCERVLVEKYAEDFTEINCAAFCGKDGEIFVSPCEKPINRGEILSFGDKYKGGDREFPAKIEEKLSEKIRLLTQKAYIGLNAQGVIRIDYIIAGGEIFLNEINTVPGSLAYYLFCKNTAEYKEMLSVIIEGGLNRSAKRQSLIKKFPSGILNIKGTKGAKRLKT